MKAKFLTVGSFLIRSRQLFVAVGDVIEGQVKQGMRVTVSLGNISVEATVKEVEIVEVNLRGQNYVGLVFAFEDPAELEIWPAAISGGETLELST